MIKSLNELMPGDIILTRDDSLISRTIRKFEAWQTGHAEYSHTAAALGNCLCIEALWRTRISDLKKYEKSAIEVWRIPITDEERSNFHRGMVQIAGNDYGLMMLPLFGLDSVATAVVRCFGRKQPVFFFTEKFGVFNIPVCSQLVCYGLEKYTNFTIRDQEDNRVSWKLISPDYLQDLLRLPRNGATMIYKQESS